MNKRIIKFRAWDLQLKKMFYNISMTFIKNELVPRHLSNGHYSFFNRANAKSNPIVMQFTGLNEKTGKETPFEKFSIP